MLKTQGLRAGLVMTAALMLPPLCAGQAQASQEPAIWMLSRTALQNVIGNQAVATDLGSDTVYQVSDPASDDTAVTSNAIISYHEYSGAKAASDVANGVLPDGTGAIVLDQEDWNDTCPGYPTVSCTSPYDLAHPAGGATEAAQAVQEHNQMPGSAPLTMIVTPGLDLFEKSALGCSLGYTTADLAQCYLNYNMAGKMAAIPGVAVIDLQAQSLEGHPGEPATSCGTTITYWNFVCQAAGQAEAAAENAGKTIVILAGLSTDPNTSSTPSECDIQTSAQNVESLVSGFWMNVPDASTNPDAYSEAEEVMLDEGNCS
jgi:hypothetical protein